MNTQSDTDREVRLWLILFGALVVLAALFGFIAGLTAGLGWRLIGCLF